MATYRENVQVLTRPYILVVEIMTNAGWVLYYNVALTGLVQSTPVISNSLISNNRFSRSENQVPVLTQRSTNRQYNIVEKRRNCSLGAISPLFHNIFKMSLT